MKYDTVFVRRILITLANGILQSGFFSPLKIMQFRIFFSHVLSLLRFFPYSLTYFFYSLVFWRFFVSFFLSHSLYLCIPIPVILFPSTRLILYPSHPLPVPSSFRPILYPSHPIPVSSSTRLTLYQSHLLPVPPFIFLKIRVNLLACSVR